MTTPYPRHLPAPPTKNTGTVTNATPTAPPKPKPAPKPKPKPKSKSKPKPKPKKPKSALEKWLAGDTTYQQQLADFNRSKSDYEANYKRQSGIVSRDYSESQRSLNRQGTQDRMDQQNDYAGRGILRSGVFAKALGDYNTDFNARMKALTTGKTDKLGDLGGQRTNFLRQLTQEMTAAKQDAIRRRAAKLGI